MNGNIQMPPSPDFLSKDEIELLKRTMLKQFPEDEQQSFVRICQRTRLDPFVKQIYATRRYQKVRDDSGGERKVATLVPVTGILGLCAIADRTGNYNGCEIFWCGPDGEWKTEWVSEEFPTAAKCVVYHKLRTHPEIAIARWSSYVGQTYNYTTKRWEVSDFWEKMPDYMLGKVSKAAALRGAFPDPMSNVYIREELDSNLTDSETEEIPSDVDKIAMNQRQEEALLSRGKISGAKFVEPKADTRRPTPEQALEPAFEEDRLPDKPPTTSAPRRQTAPAPVVPEPRTATPPVAKPVAPDDDLDMSPAEPQRAPASIEPPQQQEAEAPAPPVEPPWKTHVIKGIKHVKYKGKTIGDLNPAEIQVIEQQWLPNVRERWDDATDDQRNDAAAFEAAIAFSKMQKPG